MNCWDKVDNIDKIIHVFGEPISFHDAIVTNIKYDGKNGSIEINCKGFINTMRLFDEKYKSINDADVKINFNNVSLFQIDGGYGYISDLVIEKDEKYLIATIDSCSLKFVCDSIEIKSVSVLTEQEVKQNKLLDKFLKSNL